MEKIPRLTPDQRSNLVAYLDGELDEPATQEIERTLARSPVARHEVEMLTRTWEMLDELPRPKASGEFTQRTLTHLSSLKVEDASPALSEQPWFQQARRGVIAAGWVIGLGLAAAIGFLLTNRWIPNESEMLVRELPVIENLDLYREVDDIEFLRELRRSKLFAAGESKESSRAGLPPYEEGRRRIEQMSETERDRLAYQFRIFRELPESQSEDYRRLHESLEEDAGLGGRLREVMQAYGDWLKTLSPWQRDELRSTDDPAARLALVRKLKEEQEQEQEGRRMVSPRSFSPDLRRFPDSGPRLCSEDMVAVIAVVERRTSLPADLREQLPDLPLPQRAVRVLSAALAPYADSPRSASRWPGEDLADEMIAAIPNIEIGQQFVEMRRPEQRRFALRRLIVRGVLAEWQKEAERHRPSEDELQKFFGELDGREREEIMRLPPDEMEHRLVWKHFSEHQPEFSDDVAELRQIIRQMYSRGRRRSRPDPRPPTEESNEPSAEDRP